LLLTGVAVTAITLLVTFENLHLHLNFVKLHLCHLCHLCHLR
jgi:hypothetical protein